MTILVLQHKTPSNEGFALQFNNVKSVTTTSSEVCISVESYYSVLDFERTLTGNNIPYSYTHNSVSFPNRGYKIIQRK